MGERRAKSVVRGTLVALRRDERARVQQVLLVTEEGLEFLVENTGSGRYLAEHLDREVEVLGLVDEPEDGRRSVRPLCFRDVGFDETTAGNWARSWKGRRR